MKTPTMRRLFGCTIGDANQYWRLGGDLGDYTSS